MSRPREVAAPLFGETSAGGAQQTRWTGQDAVEQKRLSAMHRLLLEASGQPAPREVWDPLTQLIYSLCSSRTKTPESHATLRALRERYSGWPTGPNSWDEVHWERLRDAPVPEIEETIHLATFADRKAPQLKATLQQITTRTGALSLAFLAVYRTEKIRAWLEQFPGIGSQVSAAIVNFSSLRRPVISVDGHHQRVSIRMGFAPERSTPWQVEQALMRIVPTDWNAVTMDDHHQLVKLLGQTRCTPNQPTCFLCPLVELCPTGRENIRNYPAVLQSNY
ncbi:endonuclease III domain-containing protein [Terriglobus sp.]|uniref:endonuclease III domain-containing protein n=1 Tax=Terriglobus sp. TaxID=1889013 RepID=UPI003B006C1F